MGVKVAKFGGTSVADAIQLAKVKKIVESDPERKYIIVSAPGKRFDGDNKVTDLLYLCKTHMDHNIGYDQVFQVIAERFRAIETNLGLDVGLEQEFAKIDDNIKNGASADYVASRGEYLTALLMSAYLGCDMIETQGLIAFDEKGNFLEDETNVNLEKELAKHERAVIPGFYGSTPNGDIKTFSRGGSDITGALIARAAKADIYENWTDVSGFMVADPRIVKNPAPIPIVSYKELRELSYMGASVLHEDAIYPVKAMNIPINIRNTNEPDHPGTTIVATPEISEGQVITGIAGHKDFIVIAIYKNMMNLEVGFIRRCLSILEDRGVTVEHLPTGIDTLSIVLAKKNVEGQMDDILDDIKRIMRPDGLEVYDNMAVIATVGRGMSRRAGTAATLFKALADAGINIRMIDQGSSELNIIVGVKNTDFENAIRAIYNAFIE